MRSARSLAEWIAVGFLAAAMAACAGDVVDIDRTQANRVDKKIFEGEWYFRPIVLETQFNQGLVFEGLEGEMDRIRWDIREHELIAYRSYELLEGAETGTGDTKFHGNPVAVFPILKHFDVVRDYNPSTGEQKNVLVENDTDRPWWERQYVRVDWAVNLLADPYKLEAAVQAYSGAPYYVQEHEIDNPHRAEVTPTNINVVNNYILMADMWTCYDLGLDPYFCGASDVKMKLSFMKVGERNYEKLYYSDRVHVIDPGTGKPLYSDNNGEPCDGRANANQAECTKVGLPMFERFGYFRTERRAYDEEFQWTRDGRIFLANRWNIWKRSYDGSGNLIPYEYREPSKVVYYTNVDFPTDADAWEGTELLAKDWDLAFRETVLELKRASNPSLTLDDIPTIYEVRKNSCSVENATQFARNNKLTEALAEFGITQITRGNLKRACAVLEAKSGGKFTWQKQGDLRHSFLVWVDTPQNAGPLGYGPSAADPVTGEIISANANIYGAAIDSYAAYAADIVALMNGELELDAVVNGENIRKQLESRRAEAWGDFSAAKMAEMREEFKRMAQAYGDKWIPDREQAMAYNRAKLARVKGSDLEREVLVNDEMKRALLGPDKYQPGIGDDTSFSPIAYLTEDGWRRYNKRRIQLGQHAIDMADWSDDGMVSLAAELAGKSWEEVYAFMRKNIYRAVMAHEVGHTLGLRHNFEGSFDALNYLPEFWDYYDPATGTVRRTDEFGNPTRAERLMYSTIMDYDARFYADSLEGIGPYDRAAIKFGYGQLVEVFEPGVAAFALDYLVDFNDYTEIPKLMTGELACELDSGNRACPGLQKINQLFGPDGNFLNYLAYAADSVSGAAPENIWKRQHVRFDDLYTQYVNYYAGANRPYRLPEQVPYKFCPDEYSWPSNVRCQPYDKGANYFEVTVDRMERYEKYYFFTNFKRDRYAFNDYNYVDYYLARLVDRYFLPMSNIYRYYLYGFSFMGYDNAGNPLYLNDFDLGADWQRAAMQGLNYLTSVLQQPEPGFYCLDTTKNVYRQWANVYAEFGASEPTQAEFLAHCPEAERLDIPVGVGKYYYTNWTDEYYYKATRIGTFWDKWAALYSLTDNEGAFYRNFSDFLDAGAFSLSYWRGLQEEMLDLFGDAFTGGSSKFAWRYTGGEFAPAPLVDLYEVPFDYNAPKIESATSWTLRYYSVLMPMARFNSMYDYTEDFATFGRLCLEGYIDCLDFDSNVVATEKYTDPLTGYTYVAAVPPAAAENPQWALAAELIKDARTYAAQYQAKKDAWDAAKIALAGDPDNPMLQQQEKQALLELKEVERGINERTSFLDIVRRLSYLTEYGG